MRRAATLWVLLTLAACGPLPPDRVVNDGSGVEGYVQDQSGAPLNGVTVTVIDAAGNSVQRFEKAYGTGPNGLYSVPARPGTWTVTYFRPGYLHLKVPVTIQDHVFVRRDVVLPPFDALVMTALG